jgi:tetraacyldisaccharide 4'-kinase
MRPVNAARRLEELWYGRSRLSLCLQPAAWAFRLIVALRRWAYGAGLLPTETLGKPVIVVGNLTVGGAGKTPVVVWLANTMRNAGLHPGIVSRGYGAATVRQPIAVSAGSSASQVGDEALLLARRTDVPVCVCVDRSAAARAVIEAGVDLVIADDGLQHYRMARDLEIAVIDGARGHGNGRMLPAGPLREPAARLQEVDLVLINGRADKPGQRSFRLVAREAVSLDDASRRPLTDFRGAEVVALAGIGNPHRFYDELRAAGMQVVAEPVPDHGRIDLRSLRAKVRGPILMTEKDAVKYTQHELPDVWYVPVDLVMSGELAAEIINMVTGVAKRAV